MPVTLGTPENITVDTAKILRLDINVQSKTITYVIGYGTIDGNDNFTSSRAKRIEISGEDFDTLAGTMADGAKNLYDNLSDISYAHLQSKSLI